MHDAVRGLGAPTLELARALLFTESLKQTEGKPLVLRWAMALKHVVENIEVAIGVRDYLREPRSRPVLKRFACLCVACHCLIR